MSVVLNTFVYLCFNETIKDKSAGKEAELAAQSYHSQI